MNLDRLNELEKVRELLRHDIRSFDRHPIGLEIKVNDYKLRFTIGSDGRCTQPPQRGVWGWAKGWPWKDLKKMLEKDQHQVSVVNATA